MQSRSATAVRAAASAAASRRARPSLAELHPRALYRPVPPVACDDDGYPFSDSAVSEGEVHDALRGYFRDVAKTRFAGRADVTVRGNNMVLFEEGNKRAIVSPDLFVAFGPRPPGDPLGLSFKVWQGSVPQLAVEVLSGGTWRKDVHAKRALYQDLGVLEYWIIDMLGRLPKPITGLRLGMGGRYQEIAQTPSGGWLSRVLEMEFVMVDAECRLRDPATGEIFPTYDEIALARQATKQAQRDERAARQAAERAQRDERAARQAAERKAQAAEARIAELEARLRRRR